LCECRAVDYSPVERNVQSASDEFDGVLSHSLEEIGVQLLWGPIKKDCGDAESEGVTRLFRALVSEKRLRLARGRSCDSVRDCSSCPSHH